MATNAPSHDDQHPLTQDILTGLLPSKKAAILLLEIDDLALLLDYSSSGTESYIGSLLVRQAPVEPSLMHPEYRKWLEN